ncbi:MAG: AAA family ATPase [Lachnospiraceae bacterium]|nr:AAA family ATPase [Lachnospiraceae bacterium]
MRLILCHIENFGKLHDLTIEFQRECHVLSKPNGWGKSTLAAFLRVMFFGFEGETKRNGFENERRRYRPWQGGTYGGSVTFETGGKTFTVTRIFSDKKANDSFELRDARTNLPAADFSENLGEELFHINSESFRRTVFIGQNDCETHATDSINAKLSNFTDTMNDLDSYEKAFGALQEVLNRLNPRRKTGEIYQLNGRITHLQTEIAQNQTVRSSIRQYEGMAAEEKEKLREKKREQEEVFSLQKQVSKMQDKSVHRAAYRQLSEACGEADAVCRAAAAWFPGEIPTEERLRVCQTACGEMERAAHGAQICRLSGEEGRQLEELKAQRAAQETENAVQGERYASDEEQRAAQGEHVPDEERRAVQGERYASDEKRHAAQGEYRSDEEQHAAQTERQTIREARPDETGAVRIKHGRRRLVIPGVVIAAAGAACCVVRLLSGVLRPDISAAEKMASGALSAHPLLSHLLLLGILLLAAGLILILAGAALHLRDRKEEARKCERDLWEMEEKSRKREQELREREEEERKRLQELREREEGARNRERLYEALAKKQRDYQMYREQYDRNRAYVEREFADMGFALANAEFPGQMSAENSPGASRHAEQSSEIARSAEDSPGAVCCAEHSPGTARSAVYSAGEMLQEIRQRRARWQRAMTAAEAARLKKEEFASRHEADLASPDGIERDLPDLESLNRRQRQLEADEEQIRNRLDFYRNRLSAMREEYDAWMQEKETLQSEQVRLAVLRKQYRQVKKAQEYLTAAKENLTARYMEPLMRSFTRCYRILAGESGTPAEKYHIDANTNLTVEEEGLQRETQYLSRGYQDLIGLCLRLSLADAMYPDEKPFLILDDPFVNLDEKKTAGGMRLLREVSKHCQIIYITKGKEPDLCV